MVLPAAAAGDANAAESASAGRREARRDASGRFQREMWNILIVS